MRVAMLALLISNGMAYAGAENMVSGGDFESVPVGSAGSECYSTGIPFIPGWSSNTGYQVDRFKNDESCVFHSCLPINPSGDSYSISLQGSVCCGCNNNGWIEQPISVVDGRRYRLTFDALLDRSDVLRVTCGGASVVLTGEKMPEWSSYLIEFYGTSGSTLRFASESPNGSTPDGCNACWEAQGCLLDNISLVEINCPGDVVANNVIDGADLAALLSVWGTDGGIYPRADVNGDGAVNAADLSAVLSGWGACP